MWRIRKRRVIKNEKIEDNRIADRYKVIQKKAKDNKIKFLAADTSSNLLNNMLLTISSEDENILMMLDGQISMDDVSNLINDVQKEDKTPKTPEKPKK